MAIGNVRSHFFIGPRFQRKCAWDDCENRLPHNSNSNRLHCNNCDSFLSTDGARKKVLRARAYFSKNKTVANSNEIARRVTNYAVKVGFLSHPSIYICMDCKRRQAECYDHRDYSKPLEVEAVCLPCNSSRGRGIPLVLPDQRKPKTEAA